MNLNGIPTNPGKLRTPITLYRRAIVTDGGGFGVAGKGALIAAVYSKWTNAHGQEAWAAQTVQASQPATVLIRYRADVDATCLIEKGALDFEIVSLDDIQERHEYIELKVKRITVG